MAAGTTGDPDLWGHVRFGQDMIAEGAIRLPDTYSFTTDRGWVNHEWLAEIIMALAFGALGPAGLNLFRIAVIACVLTLVWRASRLVGDHLRALVVVACAIGIYMRAHPIRPQLFSLLLFALLLELLRRAERRQTLAPLAWIPVLTAAWVNLHGGWIVGFGYFGLWSLMRSVEPDSRERVTLAGLLGLALGATLVNPYGWGMWKFLAGTVRIDRPMIGDWQPLFSLPPLLWISWLTAAGLLALASQRARSRADWMAIGSAAMLGVMALRVSRLDAFFALAAVFSTIAVLSRCGISVADLQPVRRSHAFSVAFAIAAAGVAFALVPRVATVRVPDHLMPDADVAAYAREQKLTGRVLTWFDWGEYVIWHFGPDLQVSIDGRRETVYSGDVVDAHMRFYTSTSDGWRYPDAINADYVWIPSHLPVVRDLEVHGWRTLCKGTQSTLLGREQNRPPCAQQTRTSEREFPQL